MNNKYKWGVTVYGPRFRIGWAASRTGAGNRALGCEKCAKCAKFACVSITTTPCPPAARRRCYCALRFLLPAIVEPRRRQPRACATWTNDLSSADIALTPCWGVHVSPLRELVVLEELAANLPAVVVDVHEERVEHACRLRDAHTRTGGLRTTGRRAVARALARRPPASEGGWGGGPHE